MADTLGATNGSRAPWWVQIIQTIGPTAAIAIFLVYTIAGEVVPTLQDMKLFIVAHEQQTAQILKEEQDDSAQRARQWQIIGTMQNTEHRDREAALQIEQQTCVNTAGKDDSKRDKCLSIRDQEETNP
jgi:hypothetical protein